MTCLLIVELLSELILVTCQLTQLLLLLVTCIFQLGHLTAQAVIVSVQLVNSMQQTVLLALYRLQPSASHHHHTVHIIALFIIPD